MLDPIGQHIVNEQRHLNLALSDAFNIGWDTCLRQIIETLEDADSACSTWAIELIKEKVYK